MGVSQKRPAGDSRAPCGARAGRRGLAGARRRAAVLATVGTSVLSLALLGGVACVTPRAGDGSTEAQIAAAESATRAEDWELAADLWYRVYLDDEGTTRQPYYETARALWRSGDPDSACSMIAQGLKVFPRDRGLMRLEAEVLRSSGYRRAAERCYERLVDMEPQNVEALTALGKLRLELGLESSAIEPLTRAVAISGGDAEVWLLLAKAHRVAGNVLNAYRSYSRAFELGATESSALYWRRCREVLDEMDAKGQAPSAATAQLIRELERRL